MESRNFFSIPKQSKGTLVAFQRRSEGNSNWKLGIVNRIHPITQICELFVWNGPIIHHNINDTNQNCLYPQFYFLKRGELNSTVVFEGQVYMKWQFHFTLLTIDMDQFRDFRFLNQVGGIYPEIFHFIHSTFPDRVNKFDKCYEQSPQGCDLWILPKDPIFPKLTIQP